MKKLGVLGVVVALMCMLMGCGAKTYTLQFDNINLMTVVNKSDNKEVNLTKEQIKTATEEMGKITFEEEAEALGEEYLYKLTMSNGEQSPVDIYIYDSTHMKMGDKFYTATKNEFNLIFYKSLFGK